MILPNTAQSDIEKTFPDGLDEVSMPSGCVYIRTTTNYK
jgi:peroxidase